MSETESIAALDADAVRRLSGELAEVLLDCVAGGASVSFMQDLERSRASEFWRDVARRVDQGTSIVLAATIDGVVRGTVTVHLAEPENQPHRADIAKMLVHRSARNRGIARRLMVAAEAAAQDSGRTLLMLDTVPGQPAERLYRSLDWQEVGTVPGFALFPDGTPCDTTFFWKRLDAAPA